MRRCGRRRSALALARAESLFLSSTSSGTAQGRVGGNLVDGARAGTAIEVCELTPLPLRRRLSVGLLKMSSGLQSAPLGIAGIGARAWSARNCLVAAEACGPAGSCWGPHRLPPGVTG